MWRKYLECRIKLEQIRSVLNVDILSVNIFLSVWVFHSFISVFGHVMLFNFSNIFSISWSYFVGWTERRTFIVYWIIPLGWLNYYFHSIMAYLRLCYLLGMASGRNYLIFLVEQFSKQKRRKQSENCCLLCVHSLFIFFFSLSGLLNQSLFYSILSLSRF